MSITNEIEDKYNRINKKTKLRLQHESRAVDNNIIKWPRAGYIALMFRIRVLTGLFITTTVLVGTTLFITEPNRTRFKRVRYNL